MIRLLDETKVLERLKNHLQNKTTDLSNHSEYHWSSELYSSEKIFQNEIQSFGQKLPQFLGPASELEKNHSSVVRDVGKESWIVWRTDPEYRGYLNQCRHRGMKLSEGPRCSTHLVCPYHRWSYGADGACTFIPEQKKAFPNLDLSKIQLQSRQVVEKKGLLWLVGLEEEKSFEMIDLISNQIPDLKPAQFLSTQTYDVKANWKLIQESFLESYHVPFVHEKTLSPATISHLGLNDYYGPHSRAVYPLKRLQTELSKSSEPPMRRLVSVVYQLFPNAFLSLQPFHILVTRLCPKAVDRTQVEVYSLVESQDKTESLALVEKDMEFVRKGMIEDFEVAEKVQETQKYSGHPKFMAGAYEGQIQHFHKSLFEVI